MPRVDFPTLPLNIRRILRRDPDIVAYMERHPDAEPHDAMLAVIDRLRRERAALRAMLYEARHMISVRMRIYLDLGDDLDDECISLTEQIDEILDTTRTRKEAKS
jgi:hypothetical protein